MGKQLFLPIHDVSVYQTYCAISIWRTKMAQHVREENVYFYATNDSLYMTKIKQVRPSLLVNISNCERVGLSTIIIIRVRRVSENSQGANKDRVSSGSNSCTIVKNAIEGSAPGIGSRLVTEGVPAIAPRVLTPRMVVVLV